MRAYAQRRRDDGLPLQGGASWISMESRQEIYARDGGICQLCFEPVNFDVDYLDPLAPTLDHIVPRSHGGSHDPQNLRLACRSCNTARGNRVDWEASSVSV